MQEGIEARVFDLQLVLTDPRRVTASRIFQSQRAVAVWSINRVIRELSRARDWRHGSIGDLLWRHTFRNPDDAYDPHPNVVGELRLRNKDPTGV